MMTAIPSANGNLWFCEAGVVALRRDDGSFENPRSLYLAASREELSENGLLRSEQEQIGDIAAVLAGKFAEYIRGVKGVQRLQQKGQVI